MTGVVAALITYGMSVLLLLLQVQLHAPGPWHSSSGLHNHVGSVLGSRHARQLNHPQRLPGVCGWVWVWVRVCNNCATHMVCVDVGTTHTVGVNTVAHTRRLCVFWGLIGRRGGAAYVQQCSI